MASFLSRIISGISAVSGGTTSRKLQPVIAIENATATYIFKDFIIIVLYHSKFKLNTKIECPLQRIGIESQFRIP